MSITLKPEQEEFVLERIKNGNYTTVDEVIMAAFRLLEERERQYREWVEETRDKVEVGIAQLDRGEGIDGEQVIARLRDKLRQAREDIQ